MIDDRLLEIALLRGRLLLKSEEVEDEWILEDVARHRDLLALPREREHLLRNRMANDAALHLARSCAGTVDDTRQKVAS